MAQICEKYRLGPIRLFGFVLGNKHLLESDFAFFVRASRSCACAPLKNSFVSDSFVSLPSSIA